MNFKAYFNSIKKYFTKSLNPLLPRPGVEALPGPVVLLGVEAAGAEVEREQEVEQHDHHHGDAHLEHV